MPHRIGGSTARDSARSGSDALQKLKRGDITLEEYLDARVERALVRLGRLVTEEERSVLREVAREHAMSDPVVQAYVQRALGRVADFEP